MADLTPTQQRVLAYCRQFHATQDQLPPASVISKSFGWASPNAAHVHLKELEKRGALERNAIGNLRFPRPKAEA